MKSQIFCTCAMTLVLTIAAHGQNLPQVIPPSPDAAALGKYGEIPVGTYTGVPEVGIPLYEIKSGSLSLPIGLSYHAGGVKVEDHASSVGLGWTLNAGGIITRSVQGLPDDVGNGFLMTSNPIPASMSGISNFNMKQIAQNNIDAAPDQFFFNFGRYSGKMFFDKSGNVYTIPHQNFKIKPGIGPLNAQTTHWEITTEDGIKYIFAESETSSTNGTCLNSMVGGITNWINSSYKSTWFLTRIEAPQADQHIDLTYLPSNYTIVVPSSYSRHHTLEEQLGCCFQCPADNEPTYNVSCSTVITLQTKVLTGITFRGGTISFQNSSRQDLPGASRVTAITVNDGGGNLVKKFVLDNSGFHAATSFAQEAKRMKLKSVTEIGGNNAELPPYLFHYNNEPLPPRNSPDTDYWGYYNKRSNTTPYAEFVDYLGEVQVLSTDYLPGAIRRPDAVAAKAGVLTKIIYPTGGYTSFEYELNEVISPYLPNKTEARVSRSVAGSTMAVVQSSPFTIDGHFQPGQFVDLSYQTTGCSASSIPTFEDLCPYVQIVGINGTTYSATMQSGNLNLEQTRFLLPNGQYRLKGGEARNGQSFSITASWEPDVDSPNKPAGGLRILRITDSDGSGNYNLRKFEYNDTDGASTGRLLSRPKNFDVSIRWKASSCGSLPACIQIPEVVISSNSNTTLGTTRGGYVGYGKVTELRGEIGEYGKTEYEYTSVWKSNLYADTYNDFAPYGPAMYDRESSRGFLLRKTDFRYTPSGFLRVMEANTEYKPIGTGVEILGLMVAVKIDNPCDQSTLEFGSTLLRRSGGVSWVPDYKIERKFADDGATSDEVRTDLTFNPVHLQLTNEVVTFQTSPLWKRETKLSYPTDYTVTAATDAMAQGLNQMKTVKHIHSPVIEKQVWENKTGTITLVDGQISFFKSNGIELDKQVNLLVSSSNPIEAYVPSAVSGSGNFVYETSKFRDMMTFDAFDTSTGNILEMTGGDGIKRSYLWDDSKLYPIAEVVNASHDAASYTSFEAGAGGNWSLLSGAQPVSGDGITGTRYFVGSMETNAVMPVGAYIISCWASGTGNLTINGTSLETTGTVWAPYVRSVTLSAPAKIQIASNGIKIDELRAYPASAQMKSFVHEPLVGIAAANSESNVPLRFQYDNNVRLRDVLDHTGTVVKRNTYNLKGYNGEEAGDGINASFSVNGSLSAGSSLTFTAVNTDATAQYDWEFGDGNVSANGGRVLSHTYSEAGVYYAKLTASKNGESSFSYQTLAVTVANLPPPTITVSSVSYAAGFPPFSYPKLTVNATLVPAAGGVAPYTSYVWAVESTTGAIVIPEDPEDDWITTTPTATLKFQIPPMTIQACVPDEVTYIIKGRAVDSEYHTSEFGSDEAYYKIAKTFDVSPLEDEIGQNQAGPVSFTVEGSESNITVTPNASWISVSQLDQCAGFSLTFLANTGSYTERTGTVSVVSSNGSRTVTITQAGQCAIGCTWNGSQCVCP